MNNELEGARSIIQNQSAELQKMRDESLAIDPSVKEDYTRLLDEISSINKELGNNPGSLQGSELVQQLSGTIATFKAQVSYSLRSDILYLNLG
jgi:hypothetical protein